MCESVRIRDVGIVDVKALAFVVPKECLDPETFAINPTSFLGRFDVGDQMDGFLAILSPPGDGIHRSVLFASEQDSRSEEIFSPPAVWNHVIKAKGHIFPVEESEILIQMATHLIADLSDLSGLVLFGTSPGIRVKRFYCAGKVVVV